MNKVWETRDGGRTWVGSSTGQPSIQITIHKRMEKQHYEVFIEGKLLMRGEIFLDVEPTKSAIWAFAEVIASIKYPKDQGSVFGVDVSVLLGRKK